MPIIEFDRDSIEVGDSPVSVTLFELLQLHWHVIDHRIDLAADVVLAAQICQQRRKRTTGLRHKLQHHQSGHDASVDRVKLTEVIVARNLSGKGCIFFGHSLFDECMSDSRCYCSTTVMLNRIWHCPTCPNVVQDR